MRPIKPENMQAAALHTFGNMSRNFKDGEEIGRAIKHIAEVMGKYPSSIIVQAEGAWALLTLTNPAFANPPQAPAPGIGHSHEIVIDIFERMWRESILKTLMRALCLFCEPHSHEPESDIHKGQLACYALVSSMYSRVDESKTAPEEALRVIPLSIQTHARDAMLIQAAFNSINHATASSRNIANAEFLEKDGITAVMKAMEAHENDIELLGKGCCALASMCQERVATKYLMLEHHAPQLIIRLLKKHVANSQFSGIASITLSSFMLKHEVDPKIQETIMSLGGAEAVISALRKHKNDEYVQTQASEALAQMHRADNDNPQCVPVALWLADGLYQHVLDKMIKFPNNCFIQSNGCIMLKKLFEAYRTESSAVLAELRCACIPVLLNAATAYMSQYPIVCRACECLREACFFRKIHDLSSKHRDLVQFETWAQKKGSIKTLTQIMNAYPDDEDIQHIMMHTIYILTLNSPKNQDACRECGTIDVIIRASKLHKDSQSVLHLSREALNIITLNHAENSEYVKQHLSGTLATRMKKTCEEDFQNFFTENKYPKELLDTMRVMMDLKNACTKGQDITAEVARAREREKLGQKCVVCGKTAAGIGARQLLKCSGCTIAPLYCGGECQKAHWKTHKAECKANKKAV
jgi:hypothetical protein